MNGANDRLREALVVTPSWGSTLTWDSLEQTYEYKYE